MIKMGYSVLIIIVNKEMNIFDVSFSKIVILY